MPSQLWIARRVENVIRQNGIPTHVRKLKPVDTMIASLPQEKFLSALRKYVRGYHSHSSLIVTNTHPSTTTFAQKNRSTSRKSQETDSLDFRPVPKLFLSRSILTIRLGVFVTTLGLLRTVRRDWDAHVHTVRAALKAARLNNSGIILDLRLHSGGNFKPMVDMFRDMFRNTTLFAWCNDAPNKTSTAWSNLLPDAKREWSPLHHSYEGKTSSGPFISGELSYPCKIAVLIGRKTYSSGEIGAAMFYGKAGVCFFGENSGGGLSVNGGFHIAPGMHLNLTTSLIATTDNVMHLKEYLRPDVYTQHPLKDARAWLRQQ